MLKRLLLFLFAMVDFALLIVFYTIQTSFLLKLPKLIVIPLAIVPPMLINVLTFVFSDRKKEEVNVIGVQGSLLFMYLFFYLSNLDINSLAYVLLITSIFEEFAIIYSLVVNPIYLIQLILTRKKENNKSDL